jgi:hypothetical protein
VQEGVDARPGEGLQVVEVAEHGEHDYPRVRAGFPYPREHPFGIPEVHL